MKSSIGNSKFLLVLLIVFLYINSVYSQFSNEINTLLINHKQDLIQNDTIPSNLAPITIRVKGEHYPGNLLLSITSYTAGNYLLVLDTSITPIKYKKVNAGYNFRYLYDGKYSYNETIRGFGGYAHGIVYIMDENLKIIDSVQCDNGYFADIHEFLYLPNGHKVLIAYVSKMMDLSKLAPNGNPNANVIGGMIQELDRDNNVVFEWFTWDHVDITETYQSLSAANVGFDHINAVEVDYDGNFLASFRHLNQIIKIDRKTGKIIWRLGGKKNEFEFIDEDPHNAPLYFNNQHDIRRLPNGNIMIYDNGNSRQPAYSRVVEYELDEVNKTARMVWEYRRNPDVFGQALGSAQRLPNGNTLVSWGSFLNPKIDITEVTPDKTTVLELSFPIGTVTYRAYKVPEVLCPSLKVTHNEVFQGDTYDFGNNNGTTAIQLFLKKIIGLPYNSISVTKYECPPQNALFEGPSPYVIPYHFVISGTSINQIEYTLSVNLNELDFIPHPGKLGIYKREKHREGVFQKLTGNFKILDGIVSVDGAGFGEIIIAFEDEYSQNPKPKLVSPPNNSKTDINEKVVLDFNVDGYFEETFVEVSNDENFENGVTTFTGKGKTSYLFENLIEGKKYFWRAKAKNPKGESPWSEVWNFTPMQPYITIISPNGGERWQKDTAVKYIIKWDDNIDGLIRIELLKDDKYYRLIRDSVNSPMNIFVWTIPQDIPSDSTYKIRVYSLKYGNVIAESAGYFAIRDKETSVAYQNAYDLEVYPNPFMNIVNIKFKNHQYGKINIKLFDTEGKMVNSLFESELDAGDYVLGFDLSKLTNGLYFLRLANGNEVTLKIIVKN